MFSLDKVPTLYSKTSDPEPKEPSCSNEKITPQTKCENSITFLQSLKGFRVGHLNIASLVKHIDKLKIYLKKEPLDVLSINETRLDETISIDTVSIPGYDMVAKNRNRQGGGVAIYHSSILNVIDRDDLVPEDVEAVCLEIIKLKSKPVVNASAYRPPKSQIEFLDKIEVLFQNLDNEHKELMIIGDLN
ncbi:RNA-directed DNA polymerase from transposon BS, partial [Paramuricea clavata]